MRSPKRSLLTVGTATVFVLAACGGSDDAADEPADTDAPVETDAPADTEPPATDAPAETDPPATDAPVETDPPTTDAPAETDPPTTDAPVDGDPVSEATVSLVEWGIEAPTVYAAGEVTFNAVNDGNFPHELVVIAGEGYESLPRAGGGAVLEEELPTGALIGRTPRFQAGFTEALTFDLAPGNYVLVCNLGSGINNHAGQGQRLDISVVG